MINLTDELKGLYEGYLGNASWQKFISNCPEVDYTEFSEFNIPKDIIKAMLGTIGPVIHTKKWLISEIPALDYKKPINILKKYKYGEKVIRSVLMRM